MAFHDEQLERLGDLWERMLTHPFLTQTRDGTIPGGVFARWMQQDYLFVEAALPFMGALIAKAPAAHRQPLGEAMSALHDELRLFEERGQAAGVALRGQPPTFIAHAYSQFLFASAAYASYAEAYTVLYVAEKAYHEAWSVVRSGLPADSPWMPFVENWAGEGFAGYVGYLEGELDELAGQAGIAERLRMGDYFELTTKYELAFWEMALTAEDWPGLTRPV